MNQLSLAITIATEAHDGAVDKSGQPYILHPLRVMQAMETDEERVVAVLHDVIEDSKLTITDLAVKLDLTLGQSFALVTLTHLPHEPYRDYIDRVRGSVIASKVKLADLEDNVREDRLSNITDEVTRERLRSKYLDARERLTRWY